MIRKLVTKFVSSLGKSRRRIRRTALLEEQNAKQMGALILEVQGISTRLDDIQKTLSQLSAETRAQFQATHTNIEERFDAFEKQIAGDRTAFMMPSRAAQEDSSGQ